MKGQVPKGRLKRRPFFSRPFGTQHFIAAEPNAEALGYSQMSLRDTNKGAVRALENLVALDVPSPRTGARATRMTFFTQRPQLRAFVAPTGPGASGYRRLAIGAARALTTQCIDVKEPPAAGASRTQAPGPERGNSHAAKRVGQTSGESFLVQRCLY